MSFTHILRAAQRLALPVLLVVLGGCASQRLQDQGMVMIDEGRLEEGLALMRRATVENPGDLGGRVALIRARENAVERIMAEGREAELEGRHDEAAAAYQRAQAMDPDNPRVRDALRMAGKRDVLGEILIQARAAVKKGDLDAAERLNANVLALNPIHEEALGLRTEIDRARLRDTGPLPQMRSKLSQPVSLEFRDAPLKMVLDVLSRASGINFLLDKDVRGDTKVTIFVRQVPIEDAIELMLVQNQLERRLINDSTVLIYPNTPQKTKELQDLVIKTFYITNGDVKQTLQMVKTILKTADVYIDERLNLLVMRDTPEVVRLAERLIASQDLAEAEVMLEVEVLEVTRNKLTELGLKYPSQFTTPGGNLANAQIINNARIGINSGLVLNLKKEDGDTNILASPRIRVRSRERAKVHIGDRVPVVTAIVTPSTGTPVTTDSIQYLEVGLKLEVEPTVYLDDDVSIRVGLEVSTFQRLPPTPNGTTPIQVSTRNAATMLRLHDGETQVLMGLVRDDDTRTATRVPILGDIPGLGRLFSSELSDKKKTEVVLLITPHVVRNVRRPEVSFGEMWSGTEEVFRLAPPLSRTEPPVAVARVAAPTGSAATAPAVAGEGGFKLSPSLGGAAAAPNAAESVASGAVLSAPEQAAPEPARVPAAPPPKPVLFSWQGPASVNVGQEFTISLEASSEAPLTGASFQIGFDASVLEVLNVEAGTLMRQQGAQASFRQRLDPVGGRLAVGLVRDGEGGATGAGTLVSMRLRAKMPDAGQQVHLMSAAPIGLENALLPLQASGPFNLVVKP